MRNVTTLLLALAVMGASVPALADDADWASQYAACTLPADLPKVDGETATKEQMLAAHAAVVGYMSGANSYQECLRRFLGAKHDTATFVKSIVPPELIKQVNDKIEMSEHLKQRFANEYNDAVKQYQLRH